MLQPPPCLPVPHAARAAERGFGLLEVSLALVVIAVATLGSVSWTLSGMNLERANQERADAHDALRQLCEELQALPLDEVFARCNADPSDDPAGPGTARGGSFTIEATRAGGFLDANSVQGTTVKKSATKGKTVTRHRRQPLAVTIRFPVDAEGRLVESAQDLSWADSPWDLDGDGEITTTPITGSFQLLPVRVQLAWVGAGGSASVSHVRLLGRRTRPGAGE